MADNYLEKRYSEVFGSKKTVRKVGTPLDTLLQKNRSVRGYDHSVQVSPEVLRRIVSVCAKIPSARNQQVLRFSLVSAATNPEMAVTINRNIKMGGALPELHLPLVGTEPQAFIVVSSTIEPDHNVYIDLGIALQSMLLKAVEIGLNGIIIGAFNHDNIREALQLKYQPLSVLCIGKSAERFTLVPIREADSHKYYRDDANMHYVPKVCVDDLIIN